MTSVYCGYNCPLNLNASYIFKEILLILVFVHSLVYINRHVNACVEPFFFPFPWLKQDKEDSRLLTVKVCDWIFLKQAHYSLLVAKVTSIFEKMIFECTIDCHGTSCLRAWYNTNMSDLFWKGENEILRIQSNKLGYFLKI